MSVNPYIEFVLAKLEGRVPRLSTRILQPDLPMAQYTYV